ncbi:MAG: HD domain-containing protein [Candidatus Aminicenantes bacterium]|nr:HD domain-containing protein [Candidatus Aminicenantes bacterium]
MNLFDKGKSGPQPVGGLQAGANVDWVYRVQEIQRKKTYKGTDYLDLTVMDKSGKMPAKIWDNIDHYHGLIKAGEIYRISGEVREYKGNLQLSVSRLRRLEAGDGDFPAEDFEESPPFDSQALMDDLAALLDANLSDPHLRRLVELFQAEFGPVFRQAYGAMKIHHAFAGGLLQHTHSLLKLILAVAPLYDLDRELLLVGALFHDIGKTAEFRTQPALESTLAGGLLGHLVISLEIFLEMKKRVPDFPEPLSLRIQHLIVSHHGEKEFGSPEVPKTREAYVLHLLDLLDSRLSIFSEQLKAGDAQKLFSEFIPALGTRILLEK